MSVHQSEVEGAVPAIVAHSLKVDVSTVSADARLDALGISSMKVLRMIAELERRYGVELPDEVIFRCETVADLARVVGERTAP